jgi:hypothetical protein
VAILFQIFLEVAEIPDQGQGPPQPASKLPQLEVVVETAHVLVPAGRVASKFSYKTSSEQFPMPVNELY